MSQETEFDVLRQKEEERVQAIASAKIAMYKWEDRELKELEANPPHGRTHHELFAMSRRYYDTDLFRLGEYYLKKAKAAESEYNKFMEDFKSIILATSRARIKSNGEIFVIRDKAIATDHDIIVKLDNGSWYRYEEVELV